MIKHIVELTIPNAGAEQFYGFMINPGDEQYNRWWPEEHLRFHITKHGDKSHLGDEVYVDEYLGARRRLSFRAVVTAAKCPDKIIWQMKAAGVKLPALVILELRDSPDGLLLRHELRLGFSGTAGKLTDPFIKLYFNKAYRTDLERHCRIEWFKLAELLSGQAGH